MKNVFDLACFWQSSVVVLHRNQNNAAMDKKKSHYLVHGLFWKEQMHNSNYLEAKKDKLCSINKTFANANLSKARLEAFAYYQSLIDVLYEALGDNYTTDQQARIDLQVFLHAGCSTAVTRIGKMTFDDNLFNEIAVYWVNDKEKRLIHGIWYRPKEELHQPDELLATMGSNLIKEHAYYERNNLPFENDTLCDMTDLHLGFQFVLPTPFDWDGFNNEILCQGAQALTASHL